MNLTNKKNDKKKNSVLGDRNTFGTLNIKFFWSSKRYLYENVVHASALFLFIFAILITIIWFILAWTGVIVLEANQPATFTSSALVMTIFIACMTGVILKLKERKIRKERERNFVYSNSRKIENDLQ